MANESPEIQKLLYSKKDVAYALSISVRSVDNLISSGKLKIHRLGKRTLIHVDDLKKFARMDHFEAMTV